MENAQAIYILYLNSKDNFRETKKTFKGENADQLAIKWGKKNLPNFHIDMLRSDN